MGETSSFIIRYMDRRHIPQVLEIERVSYPAPWSETTFSNEMISGVSVAIVALVEDSVAGYVVGWVVADQLHIANIAVSPGHQRKGIGNGMMTWLLEVAVRKGCTSSSLEVRESNLAARSMYSRLGYRSVAIRKGYYANPAEDAVVMLKDL